jgi:predicted RNase H-like HicB family nuclease
MSESLRDKARKLAAQPYKIIITNDETTDGDPIVVVYNPELPGCMAQGNTIAEAQESLREAREEYILSLLEDNLPIPVPEQYAVKTGIQPDTFTISFTVRSNVTSNSSDWLSPEEPNQLAENNEFQFPSSPPDEDAGLDSQPTSIEVRQL